MEETSESKSGHEMLPQATELETPRLRGRPCSSTPERRTFLNRMYQRKSRSKKRYLAWKRLLHSQKKTHESEDDSMKLTNNDLVLAVLGASSESVEQRDLKNTMREHAHDNKFKVLDVSYFKGSGVMLVENMEKECQIILFEEGRYARVLDIRGSKRSIKNFYKRKESLPEDFRRIESYNEEALAILDLDLPARGLALRARYEAPSLKLIALLGAFAGSNLKLGEVDDPAEKMCFANLSASRKNRMERLFNSFPDVPFTEKNFKAIVGALLESAATSKAAKKCGKKKMKETTYKIYWKEIKSLLGWANDALDGALDWIDLDHFDRARKALKQKKNLDPKVTHKQYLSPEDIWLLFVLLAMHSPALAIQFALYLAHGKRPWEIRNVSIDRVIEGYLINAETSKLDLLIHKLHRSVDPTSLASVNLGVLAEALLYEEFHVDITKEFFSQRKTIVPILFERAEIIAAELSKAESLESFRNGYNVFTNHEEHLVERTARTFFVTSHMFVLSNGKGIAKKRYGGVWLSQSEIMDAGAFQSLNQIPSYNRPIKGRMEPRTDMMRFFSASTFENFRAFNAQPDVNLNEINTIPDTMILKILLSVLMEFDPKSAKRISRRCYLIASRRLELKRNSDMITVSQLDFSALDTNESETDADLPVSA
jgi:hypothetical protein